MYVTVFEFNWNSVVISSYTCILRIVVLSAKNCRKLKVVLDDGMLQRAELCCLLCTSLAHRMIVQRGSTRCWKFGGRRLKYRRQHPLPNIPSFKNSKIRTLYTLVRAWRDQVCTWVRAGRAPFCHHHWHQYKCHRACRLQVPPERVEIGSWPERLNFEGRRMTPRTQFTADLFSCWLSLVCIFLFFYVLDLWNFWTLKT